LLIEFIINTEPNSEPGQHWQAVYIDARPEGDQSVEFYDSYGDPPTEAQKNSIKKIVVR